MAWAALRPDCERARRRRRVIPSCSRRRKFGRVIPNAREADSEDRP